MTLIRAGAVAIDGQIRRPGWVQTAGRRIVACGVGTPPQHAGAGIGDCLDLGNSLVVPGFVDMHVHGGGGASFAAGDAAEAARVAAFHLRHGTTTMLASLVTAAPAELVSAVSVLAEAIGLSRLDTVAGIHLEGPWLAAARCGAHDRSQLRVPDLAEIDAVLAAAGGTIRMVTLAPELAGSDAAIGRFLDAGAVVAVGHTDATYEQTKTAIARGATVATHLFNAMPPLHHREPGPALALLQDSRVTVELIADGVHLHPAVVHAVIGAVGADRVAVVTDATTAAGCGDGAFQLGSVHFDVESGVARVRGTPTVAGSLATMDQLFRAVAARGPERDAALAAAVQMTSTNPARALGLDRVGQLATGYDANLVVLEPDLQVTAVMANGDWRAPAGG
ncbi:N-acetylglucosamine-6-phosphate deacetylase [Mycobacterium spongiae]|uniref:N-acetylglucosamine-6-phosphate deacetylase n=1 Tax=Mycobacterium spongiae TaxID=886343 RepID=A0A975PWC9_9MYCO|nr:N-acetylglucosamine-6-phosphate deacetylase [Mycobacterium spongiae]QUR66553.1 N-acetylglucosamine-6-phosphate deacetylase [Mycobacterium spongiae]